jgi:hypothetical protein
MCLCGLLKKSPVGMNFFDVGPPVENTRLDKAAKSLSRPLLNQVCDSCLNQYGSRLRQGVMIPAAAQ